MTNIDPADDGPFVLETHPVGAAGEHLAAMRFTKMGWGAVENKQEDVGHGIDMFVDVRRRSAVKPGFVSEGWMVAQVKTGPSQFGRPTEGGWWFGIDSTDRDNWLNRPLAHVLVIVNLETEVAYWAELTASSVVAARDHYKVFVPAAQTISPECEEALRVVHRRALGRAAGHRGSAWVKPGEAIFGADEELLAAVLAPRLVAPHPNLLLDAAVTSAQAVAMVCAGRLGELETNLEVFSARGGAPTFDSILESDEWGWRLVGALVQLGTAHTSEIFVGLADSAGNDVERAVASVAAACSMARLGAVAEAAALLEAHHASFKDFLAGWIGVQRARFARRLGQLEVSRSMLDALLPILKVDQYPWQTTVLIALHGARLNLGRIDKEDLATAVRAADSPPSWWTSQTRGAALDAHIDTMFAAFSPQGSIRFVSEDVAQNRLAGGILSADLAGDQGRYIHDSKLAARRMAIESDSDPAVLAGAVEILNECGDEQGVANLAARLLRVGAYAELAALWKGANNAEWWQFGAATARLAKAILTVLPEVEVDALAFELADALEAGQRFHRLDSYTSLSLITATIGRGSTDSAVRVFDVLRSLHESGSEEASLHLCAALGQLDDGRVRARLAEIEALQLVSNTSVANAATRRLAGLGHGPALDRLAQQAERGDLEAFAARLNIQGGASTATPAAVGAATQAVQAAVQRAQASIRPGTPWAFEVATHVAARSGDDRLWQLLVDALTDPAVGGDEKTAAIEAMLKLEDSTPEPVKDRLRKGLESLDAGAHWDPTERETSTTALRLGLGEVLGTNPNSYSAASICLTAREPLARELGIAITLRTSRVTHDERGAVLALQALLADEDTVVRGAAVRGIVDIACHSDEQASWLGEMLGSLTPAAIRQVAQRIRLHAIGADGDRARNLLTALSTHSDPFVRRIALQVLTAAPPASDRQGYQRHARP